MAEWSLTKIVNALLVCGYNECPAALDFHHRDATLKEFGIGTGDIKSWGRVKIELDKCDLVCRNCHAEIHYTGD